MPDVASDRAAEPWLRFHAATAEDETTMAGLRAVVEPNKGKMQGPAARATFDAIMMRVAAPDRVSFRPGTVGGVPGWWCEPAEARSKHVLLHLHGGWYQWGSASAFRHLVGHIAHRAGATAFLPDYRLAPEHPFPAAVRDVQACYRGLIDDGARRIAISGDSAGGGLALGLLHWASAVGSGLDVVPVGAAVLSPVTDLSLGGESWVSRAEADPYFTRVQVVELVRAYLAGHAAADPLASPLHADLTGLPPLRVHVGDAEMLLDDSRRYVARAVAAGVDATLDVWGGMPHGFAGGVGRIAAADAALTAIGAFLAERLVGEPVG